MPCLGEKVGDGVIKRGENEASVVVWEFRTEVCSAGRRD